MARPHDREVFALAIPALGALAAEPLYVLVDTAIVGHLGTVQLAALAIAAQVMVGRLLGAGDGARARAAAVRVILWSAVVGAGFGLVLVALTDVLPHAFTGDERVVERAQEVWCLFAALMPLNGVVFALDGILIGAGDTRFLMWGMLISAAVYVPVALLALDQGWGIEGVWWGLAGLIGMRALTNGARFLGGRWVLTGAPA